MSGSSRATNPVSSWPNNPLRFPRWKDVAPYLRMRSFDPNSLRRRLNRALTVADLREVARHRVPRAVFDYVDGAAESETSLARARQSWDRIEFHPRVLRDVREVDLSTTITGKPSSLPLVCAPTGFTRMMSHEGERAVAAVAAAHGIPYTLSTLGTTSIPAVATASGTGRHWFQLYISTDRGVSKELVEQATEFGYDTLVLTVDTAVGGARLRDIRDGFTVPPTLSARTLMGMVRHPGWSMNKLFRDPLEFSMFTAFNESPAELAARMFDPGVTMSDLEWLRGIWTGPLVVKGLQTVDDARAVVTAGADAVVVSNHGGRQLDRAVTPLELLPQVLDGIGGDTEVLLDSGIMRGSDLAAAVAMGATACLIGRAYLYGLMAGGARGVDRTLDIMTDELARTLRLIGVNRIDALQPAHVTLRPTTPVNPAVP